MNKLPEDTDELREQIHNIFDTSYLPIMCEDELIDLITLHTQKARENALMSLHGYLSISKWSSDDKSYEKGMNDRLEDIMQAIEREVKSMGKEL